MNKITWLPPLLVTFGVNLLAIICYLNGFVFIDRITDFVLVLFLSTMGAKTVMKTQNNQIAMSVVLICIAVHLLGVTIHTQKNRLEQSKQSSQSFIDDETDLARKLHQEANPEKRNALLSDLETLYVTNQKSFDKAALPMERWQVMADNQFEKSAFVAQEIEAQKSHYSYKAALKEVLKPFSISTPLILYLFGLFMAYKSLGGKKEFRNKLVVKTS